MRERECRNVIDQYQETSNGNKRKQVNQKRKQSLSCSQCDFTSAFSDSLKKHVLFHSGKKAI